MSLSILVPARMEESLQRTIDSLFEKAETDIEVLVALDNWENPPDITVPNGQIIRTAKGQRGATNELAKLSTRKYLMKLDAHCLFSKGFDRKLLEDMEDNVTLVPSIGNLHVYDWLCPLGHRRFQGKYEKCEQCESTDLHKESVWQVIAHPIRSSFYFDTSMHFQYMPEDPPELLHETMSIQGSCFVVTREKYWELGLCDEAFGSWGTQGIEVAVKTWLSGGRVLASRKVFYGHQFRETEGFPYLNPDEDIFKAQQKGRDLFLENAWDKQIHGIEWLVRKFNLPGDWSEEKITELVHTV